MGLSWIELRVLGVEFLLGDVVVEGTHVEAVVIFQVVIMVPALVTVPKSEEEEAKKQA